MANRGHLTPCDDDCTQNTGRLVVCPVGLGGHDAYMTTKLAELS